MSLAIIYPTTKSTMQSGERWLNQWHLDFVNVNKTIDQFMGWTGSKDCQQQVKLVFASKEQAINFAEKEKISYEVLDGHKKKFVSKRYADNFQ